MNGRPTLADQCGQFKAINAPGHIDIGEDDTNIRTGFEDPDRICGVSSFNRFETCIFDHVECGHSKDRFIFYDQNKLAFHGSILSHQVFPSQGCCIWESGASIDASRPSWW